MTHNWRPRQLMILQSTSSVGCLIDWHLPERRGRKRGQSDLSVSQLLQPTKVSNCNQISAALSAILNANPSPRHDDDSFKLENVRLLQPDKVVADALPAQLWVVGWARLTAEQSRAELSWVCVAPRRMSLSQISLKPIDRLHCQFQTWWGSSHEAHKERSPKKRFPATIKHMWELRI